MGTAYQIRCKHCGKQFSQFTPSDYGVMPMEGTGEGGYIETETPIRCPACHQRLNESVGAFHEQVKVTYVWD